MIVYETGVSYRLLDSEVTFYSDETAYGWNVVAEYYDIYHNLGNESVTLELAINFWQEHNHRTLTPEELIMEDNQN